MRRRSVRARAAAAAVLALLPVLAAAAVLGVVLQRHQLDQAVQLVAEEQARSVARELDAENHDGEGVSLGTSLGGEETLVQVVDDAGSVTDATPALRDRAPLVVAPGGALARTTITGSVVGEEEADRYAAVAVPLAGGGYVVAARSLESVQVATDSSVRLFAIGVPLVVALVGALSWLLVGRALSPVEALRRRATEVTAAGSGTRLPVEPTGDEIERLARTLNAMLERLDSAAVAQQRFVADASHELRSPVAAIRAVMEVAPPGPPTWEEAREDVLGESRRLEHLVTALLTLARRDASAQVPAASLPVVRLLDVVGPELDRPRRHPVVPELTGDPRVRADAGALDRLLGNLLDNADRHAATQVTVAVRVDDHEAVVVVTDDGGGIPAADAERVFDRFVRLDESRARDAGGAGLGLAIARAVAEDHGGRLTVESAAPEGARLVLRLPLA